jgi:hypothetical protein
MIRSKHVEFLSSAEHLSKIEKKKFFDEIFHCIIVYSVVSLYIQYI